MTTEQDKDEEDTEADIVMLLYELAADGITNESQREWRQNMAGRIQRFITDPECKKHEWISVKNKYPESQGEYLVYSTSDPRLSVKTIEYLGKACFAICSKSEGQSPNWKREIKTGFYIESIYTPEVTHWMPLPNPPKELSKDE